MIDDGSEIPELDEPARDYVPSTRPGGRLRHLWLPDRRSTLDLVNVTVPTVLVCGPSSNAPCPQWSAPPATESRGYSHVHVQ